MNEWPPQPSQFILGEPHSNAVTSTIKQAPWGDYTNAHPHKPLATCKFKSKRNCEFRHWMCMNPKHIFLDENRKNVLQKDKFISILQTWLDGQMFRFLSSLVRSVLMRYQQGACLIFTSLFIVLWQGHGVQWESEVSQQSVVCIAWNEFIHTTTYYHVTLYISMPIWLYNHDNTRLWGHVLGKQQYPPFH